ncbi:hypothetical protein, partial [Candidatus Nitrotoga sp. BS]|uniref:hypothetical protein n=1 Tax=Candidatus Nitrotoga sp. BS TaxID=2890408 RepID=UPI001EF2BA65
RTVLRGLGAGDRAWLPDIAMKMLCSFWRVLTIVCKINPSENEGTKMQHRSWHRNLGFLRVAASSNLHLGVRWILLINHGAII